MQESEVVVKSKDVAENRYSDSTVDDYNSWYRCEPQGAVYAQSFPLSTDTQELTQERKATFAENADSKVYSFSISRLVPRNDAQNRPWTNSAIIQPIRYNTTDSTTITVVLPKHRAVWDFDPHSASYSTVVIFCGRNFDTTGLCHPLQFTLFLIPTQIQLNIVSLL